LPAGVLKQRSYDGLSPVDFMALAESPYTALPTGVIGGMDLRVETIGPSLRCVG